MLKKIRVFNFRPCRVPTLAMKISQSTVPSITIAITTGLKQVIVNTPVNRKQQLCCMRDINKSPKGNIRCFSSLAPKKRVEKSDWSVVQRV